MDLACVACKDHARIMHSKDSMNFQILNEKQLQTDVQFFWSRHILMNMIQTGRYPNGLKKLKQNTKLDGMYGPNLFLWHMEVL